MPRSNYLTILQHNIHITEWGNPDSPPVVMWHGLSRTGRDFDTIARHLGHHYFVLCPDTIGRGLSSWSEDPEHDYLAATYIKQAELILDAYDIEKCAWIGTSMGGIIGMGIASQPESSRIGALILNDVGGEVNGVALHRIKHYVTQMPTFPNMTEFEQHIRKVHAAFGPHTDEQWRHMAETSFRRTNDGHFTNHYDPQVMQVFAKVLEEGHLELWNLYDAITCPTLVIRGDLSDLLLDAVAKDMSQRGPKAPTVTVPNCGHAPGLNTEEQIVLVEAFLSEYYSCSL